MRNIERIRKMSEQELADYIYSVYLSGRLAERKQINGTYEEKTEDYVLWLNNDCKDDCMWK